MSSCAITTLQTMAAELYAQNRETYTEFPEAADLYAQRAAALSLAARVLAGIERPGAISAAVALELRTPPSASRWELDQARQALRVMARNEGQLHLRIAQLETELAGLRRSA